MLRTVVASLLLLIGCPTPTVQVKESDTGMPCEPRSWYADADADGYGDPSALVMACEAPPSFVAESTDCYDAAPEIHPGAQELCDGFDNNCDGSVDGSDAMGGPSWYVDADVDGFGDATLSVVSCSAPPGYIADSSDCDDTDAEVHPGADEPCDEIDNDCDGSVDGEIEICGDEIDQDCDGRDAHCSLSGTVTAEVAVLYDAADQDNAYSRLAGIGDVDGDGYDDFLIGGNVGADSHMFDPIAFLVQGGMLPEGGNLDAMASQISSYGDSNFGSAGLPTGALGDINGDGFAEFGASSTPYHDWWDNYVGIFGGPGIDSSDVGDAPILIEGSKTCGAIGSYGITGGDANGDGISDMLLLGTDQRLWWGPITQDQSCESSDVLLEGHAYAADGGHDVDGDGLMDFAIGNYYYANDEAGVIYIVSDPPSGASTLSDVPTQIIGEKGENLGPHLHLIGDRDQDGYDELASRDYASDTTLVWHGPLRGVLGPGDAVLTIQGDEAHDYLGYTYVDAGDVTGAGGSYLLLGASAESSDYFCLLGPDVAGAAGSADCESILQGADGSSGYSVSGAGDVDGDGRDDFIIGAFWQQAHAGGYVLLYFGWEG